MRKFSVFLFVLCLVGCASFGGRQAYDTTISVYARAALLYDMAARTAARACILHNVPEEKCDEWGRVLEEARRTLLDYGNFLDAMLALEPAPECLERTKICTTEECRQRNLQICYEQQMVRYSRAIERTIGALKKIIEEARG